MTEVIVVKQLLFSCLHFQRIAISLCVIVNKQRKAKGS